MHVFKVAAGVTSTFCIALGATSCGTTEPELPSSVRIGVILAETGPASFIGGPERLVLEAMMEERSGTSPAGPEITLDFVDSGGDVDVSRAQYETFAFDAGIVAVIGPSTSDESIPIARVTDNFGLTMLSLGASRQIVFDGSNNVRPWSFHFAQSDDLAAARLASVMAGEADADVALLYSDDAFGTSGAQDFRVAAAAAGLTIVHDAAYPAALADAGPVAAAVPASATGIMIWGTTPGPALLVQALESTAHTGQVYLSHGVASQNFIDEAGASANGAILVGSRVLFTADHLMPGDPNDDVVLAYQDFWSRHGTGPPSHFGGHAYDALSALLSFLPDVPGGTTATQRTFVRQSLEQLRGFHGVTGEFNFSAADHGGLTTDAFGVFRIEALEFVPYEP